MFTKTIFTILKNVKSFKIGWKIQIKMFYSWKQKHSYRIKSLEMFLAYKLVSFQTFCFRKNV